MDTTGTKSTDSIHDLIDQWHEDESLDMELHEFLGMTWEEYSLWVTKPSASNIKEEYNV